ncbi:MAG: response regulator [Pseudonocardiaceae bacterium]
MASVEFLVCLLIRGGGSGVEVVGAASDGEQAVALVAQLQPDVVLMDLRMPRCDGVTATRRIRAEHPDVQVVVLTTFADDESIFTALAAGARGYLTKDATATEIAAALRTVTAGQALLDPAVQRRLIDTMTSSRGDPAGSRTRWRALGDLLNVAEQGNVVALDIAPPVTDRSRCGSGHGELHFTRVWLVAGWPPGAQRRGPLTQSAASRRSRGPTSPMGCLR